MKKISSLLMFTALVALLNSCSSIPKGAKAVEPFEADRYLGKWYEIARLDFKFEKGLNNTTANYSINPNGTIKVLNRGYDYGAQEWKEAIGKAKVLQEGKAMLKVSFFGPFYAGYNVLALDSEYKYALVAGESLKYLWILSREKTIPAEIKTNYLNIAGNLGYSTSDLIWVEHNAE